MSNGDGPKPPIKEVADFKKALDLTKGIKWTGFSPLKGNSWTRTILMQYHGNLQTLANVPVKFMKTPLFVVGSIFVGAAVKYYKYQQNQMEVFKKQQEQTQIKALTDSKIKALTDSNVQLEQQVKELRTQVQQQKQHVDQLHKEILEGRTFFGTIKGWFK